MTTENKMDKSQLSEITQFLNHGRMVRSFMLPKFIDLPEKEWLKVPPGYKNNILWNVGHISTLADRVIFGFSELPTFFSRKEQKAFTKDSSPESWKETPDIGKVKEFFLGYYEKIETAEKEKKFNNFLAFPLGDYLYIDSTLDAVRFAMCHEGCHLGIISGIAKHLD